MPACMTLPVSSLGAATTFYLSVLRPLSYTYHGHSDRYTIAFGPLQNNSSSTSTPPDFFLTQSAHSLGSSSTQISFKSPSRSAAEAFYSAALNAGGQACSAPCLRKPGYFSAAITDRDGNCIEAVYRSDLPGESSNSTTPTLVEQIRGGSIAGSIATPAAPPASLRRDSGTLASMVSSASSTISAARSLLPSLPPSPGSTAATSTGSNSASVMGAALFGLAAGAALGIALSRDPPTSAALSPNAHTRCVEAAVSPSQSSIRSRPGPGGRRYSYSPNYSTISTSSRGNDRSYREGRKYLALEDREASTTVAGSSRVSRRSSTRVSRAEMRSTASRADNNTEASRRPKLIEAAPPSSYRSSPSVTAPTQARPHSRSRPDASSSHHDRSSTLTRSRASSHRRGSVSSTADSLATVRAAPDTRPPSQSHHPAGSQAPYPPQSLSHSHRSPQPSSHVSRSSRATRVMEVRETERVGGGRSGRGRRGSNAGTAVARESRAGSRPAQLSEANLRRVGTAPTPGVGLTPGSRVGIGAGVGAGAAIDWDVSASAPVGLGGGEDDGRSGLEVCAEKGLGRRGRGRFERFDKEICPNESISVVDFGEWEVGAGQAGRGRF